jgi:hypothetical protein
LNRLPIDWDSNGNLLIPAQLPEPPNIIGFVFERTDCAAGKWVYRRQERKYKPLWPPCSLRKKESRTEPCGCKYEIAFCENPQSEHCGQEVRPKACRACPLRPHLEEVDA